MKLLILPAIFRSNLLKKIDWVRLPIVPTTSKLHSSKMKKKTKQNSQKKK
jgi:hypothetical protein